MTTPQEPEPFGPISPEPADSVVRDLAFAANEPYDFGDGLYGRIVPAGFQAVTIDTYQLRGEPRFKSGGPVVTDAGSFIGYVDDQFEQSRIYADIDNGPGTITALFDDHDGDQPGRQLFSATYKLTQSAEWGTLTELDNVFMGAAAFAEFVEDMQHVIASPSTADLLDLAGRFRARKVVSIEEGRDDKTGDRVFRYETETQISEALIAPDEFVFVLPIYRGQDPVEVRARFRYRTGDNGVVFGLKIFQRHMIIEAAFNREVETVETALETTAVRGYQTIVGAR